MAVFDYEVTYKPGLKHLATDALSSKVTDSTDDTPSESKILMIEEGPQNENNDPEDLDLVEELTDGQGKNKYLEVIK